MRYRILSITLILCMVLISRAYSQQNGGNAITLNDAINLSLKNQPLIKQAEQEINAAEAKIKEQKSFDYPVVEGELSYTRVSPVSSIMFGGTGFLLNPANNYNAKVSALYTVFDFGKRNAMLDLTKSFKLTAEEKVNFIKTNIGYKTVQAFYSVLFLEKSLKVKNDQIKTLEQHLDITQKKVDNGTATDFDVLTTKVRVAAAKNQKIDIENAIEKAKIALRTYLGLPKNSPVNLEGDLTLLNQTTDTDSLLSKAFVQREEIKIADYAGNSLKLQRHTASLADMPSLNAIADYGIRNGLMPNLDAWRGNWAVGFTASIPIFNGYRKDAQIEEVDANLNANDEHIAALKREIKTQVEQAASDLKTSRSKISLTELEVEQAEEARSRAEASYKNGVITNLDLLDAETSVSEAKLLHLQVIYQNVINTYNLREAVGDTLN